jgi:Domain of unknown function (DUF1995)
MAELPKTLEDAIAQAREATQSAITDGYNKVQIDLLFPELKIMPVAKDFLPALEQYGNQLKVFFADAGSAGLARRDWENVSFQITDVGTGRAASIQSKVQPEDEIFLFVSPTSVEVPQLEKICEIIGERPFIMLNPRLEDSGTVGIGYTARQTRERFISTIESCYYLRPIYDEAAVFRCYPGMWEVWVKNESGDDYQKLTELSKKPSGDDLDMILAGKSPTGSTSEGEMQVATQSTLPGKKTNMLRGLQRFFKALSN